MKLNTTPTKKQQVVDRNRILESSKRTYISCGKNVLSILLISLLVNACIRIDVLALHTSLNEISVTEIVQLVLLIFTAISFYKLATRESSIRHAAILIAGFFVVLTIREMDHWLDMVFQGFWLYLALLVTTLAIVYAGRGGINTLNELASLLRLSATKQLIVWVVLLLVFSRLYGMGSLWQQVMGDHYIREVKNISEEGIELLCYSFIAISSVQIFFQLRSNKKYSDD